MKPLRVLLISNVRPLRTYNFAQRLTREVSGITIRGIVQHSLRSLPSLQQMAARREIRKTVSPSGWLFKTEHLVRSLFRRLIGYVLWLIHGLPVHLNHEGKFTIERLRRECVRAGWALVVTTDAQSSSTFESLCLDFVDLVILLGEFPSLQSVPLNPLKGFIRASCRRIETAASQTKSVLICIEHLTSDSKPPCPIASVELPWQPYDGLLGFMLKTDIIADDLLLQTAASLRTGDLASASMLVEQWNERILAPCLRQFRGTADPASQNGNVSKYCHTKWKLILDTVLLCSPWILLRNCYRRWKKQYPVLILAHHLVSDRPHRMGMPTELFLELVLYLQEHYRIVSLSQAVELLRSGKVCVPTVALTFDDGYADNFLNLRAVANETGIPATLFITTHHVESRKEFGHDLLKGMTGFLPLTWDQIRYWSVRGAEFGSHTRTHMDCGTSDREKLYSEIVGSKDDLETQLGRSVALFAFPYGQRENMSPEARQLAASTYSHFVSSFGGEAPSWGKTLQSQLFRKNFYPSAWELELELQSVFDFATAIRRLFTWRKRHALDMKARAPEHSEVHTSGNADAIQTFSDEALKQASEKVSCRSSLR